MGFSSSTGGLKSILKSYSQLMRLKWSFTSILLSKSSVLFEIFTLLEKVTVLSSIAEMSLAMVFSSKGQYPNSIS